MGTLLRQLRIEVIKNDIKVATRRSIHRLEEEVKNVPTFLCPGCGKQHGMETEFDQDFETRCLRCGETFQVTEEIVHGMHVTAATLDAAEDRDESITVRRPNGADSSEKEEGNEDRVPVTDAPLSDSLEMEAEYYDGALGSGHRRRPLKYVRSATRATDEMRRPENFGTRAENDSPEDDSETYEDRAEREGAPNAKKKIALSWGIIASLGAVVIVVAGVSAYFAFIRSPAKKAPEKVAAGNKKKETVTAPTPSTGKEIEKPDVPLEKPPVTPKSPEVVRISAARLSAELASDLHETNHKYENSVLEVSGLFEKIQNKGSDKATPQPHAVFAGAGPPVMCDLVGSPTDMNRWRTLPGEQPITVRGAYGKDGILHACELQPLTPPADGKFKGKEVELVGFVDSIQLFDGLQPFPTIVLEAETDSRGGVDCLFRKTDEEEVRKLHTGTPVTIRGTCGGRTRLGDKYRIRIDNCQVVYTSAPVAATHRLEVGQFLREYEEDLRATLRPLAGQEELVETPVSVKQLSKELATDAKAIDKYRNKIVIVSGRLHRKTPPQTLILESGDTDQVLKVQCLFGKHQFGDLDNGPDFRIRGLCSGWLNSNTLRLDNCEPFDPTKGQDIRRITAEYLPHIEDRVLTYDVAVFPLASGATPVVSRQVFLERERGLTETVTMYTGKLVGKSLFDAGEPGNWIAQKKTQKVRLPGPAYQSRVSMGFVEVGQHLPGKNGELELVWEPVLKLMAKTGDSWKWTHANAQHQYTVVKFEKGQERTSVVVQETVTPSLDPDHPSEIRHVYVRDLGEVERREVQHLSSKEKRVLIERKLIEDAGTSPPKDSKPEKSGPPEPGTTPANDGKTGSPR